MRWMFAFVFLFAMSSGRTLAQPADPDLVKALALERAMRKVIQQSETSIACVLVSRSDAYKEFDQGPDRTRPGKLGAFDPAAFKRNPRYLRLSAEERTHWQKLLDFSEPGHVPKSFGSGVVVGRAGLILTNYHVVQDATKIFVRLPGGLSSYADIHAADARCDLAVLKLLNPNAAPLRPIPLGDADKMERGQFILTLSNPFAAGFRDGQPSASWGILSNIRRRAPNQLKEEERIKPFQYYSTLLQTDARMHLGCSGGALLNLSGELVGLITSVAAIQGGETPGGFALPVNDAMREIIKVLTRGEEIDYGFLGVAFDPGNGDPKGGVVLKTVSKGSPARAGGLEEGDVLVGVNGQAIHDSDDVYTAIGAHLAGAKVRVHVRRNGVERIATVTLAKLYVPGKHIASSFGARPYFRGLRVDYSSLVVQQPGRPFGHIPQGVLVTDVQGGTPADRANAKIGDLITHVNGIAIATPAAFYQRVQEARGPVELSLYANGAKLVIR
ncbi:MAG: trypsin-like peptidase domain-containing protein [Planctomycetes bacterium]|nr:trypsin-like peptidase domain-containing protein [Planctomycetota bacterium]